MRNKPYVLGLLAAAALLIYFAIHLAIGESGPIMGAVPGVLGIALLAACWKVARADSFAPKKAERWDRGPTADVERWLNKQADEDSHVTPPR